MTKEENEKRLIYLKDIVKRLPEKPGSYQYYDADGKLQEVIPEKVGFRRIAIENGVVKINGKAIVKVLFVIIAIAIFEICL